MNFTHGEFDTFHISGDAVTLSDVLAPNLFPPPPNLAARLSTVPRQTPAQEFKCGIKGDSSLFPIIKNDLHWDNFRQSFVGCPGSL